jgi:recombinational DNA repair protein (RecF pathway)
MLYATARSVREERSKQRCALQDFSHITVTLIKGKGGWRIGSVEVHENFFMKAVSRAARGSIVKLTKAIRRYVHGEESEPLLYDTYVEAIDLLSAADIDGRSQLELCAIVRLLRTLGYVASLPAPATAVLSGPLAAVSLTDLLAVETVLEEAFSGAQAVSHLER